MSCSFDSLFRTLVLKRLRLSVFGLLALVCGGGIGVEAAPVLTSVKEIRSFSREPAGEELKVKFQGAVAARLRFRQLIFVVDGGEAVSVYAPGTNSAVNVGQRVEIEGMTVDTPGVHCLLEGLRKIGAPGPIPEPEEVSVKNLRGSDDVLQWVKLSGVVQSVRFSRGRASGRAIVTIRDRGRAFPISARRLPGLELDDYRFAHVSATGMVPRVEGGVVAGSRMLWVDSTNSFKIERAAPKFPFKKPVRPIAELTKMAGAKRLPKNVQHVRGIVEKVL